MLPEEFCIRMKEMLADEYQAFLESYDLPKYQSLRLNPLKKSPDEILRDLPFELKKVPWTTNGYYYNEEEKPGRHPYHEAGVYYIQEPSAMAPVEYLEARPGERILDLCAAPGGKSTQIACSMEGKGLIVCNEIHPARAKILSENIERMGVPNAIVTNETPDRLADNFTDYFDRILVDAPCSGEGMFRKNEDACEEWSTDNVKLCAGRQDEILECAAGMLKPGGRLVYSTCTFAPDENEGSISRFLNLHPEFRILPVTKREGMKGGNPDWAIEPAEGIEDTIRLWPHHLKGEGHYLAVLQKDGILKEDTGFCRGGFQKPISEKECRDFFDFVKDNLKEEIKGSFLKFGDQLYLMPEGMPCIDKLKVLRPGLHLGTMKKNRFEPSHALALALKPQDVKHEYRLAGDSNEIRAYLNGQTLPADGEKGWYLVTVDGYSIGWGKLAGQIMKNHYPKGLRKG